MRTCVEIQAQHCLDRLHKPRTGSVWTDRLGPDRCVNREAIGQIFHKGIYLGVSVRAHLWALKYTSILMSVCMDLYKSALWAHSMYRAYCIVWINFSVFCSLFLSHVLCVFRSKLSIKPSACYSVLCIASAHNFYMVLEREGWDSFVADRKASEQDRDKCSFSKKKKRKRMDWGMASSLPTKKLDRSNYASWSYKMH